MEIEMNIQMGKCDPLSKWNASVRDPKWRNIMTQHIEMDQLGQKLKIYFFAFS